MMGWDGGDWNGSIEVRWEWLGSLGAETKSSKSSSRAAASLC